MSGTTPSLDITLKLSRPVNVLGTPASELTLREPIGNDIAEAGYPILFDKAGRTIIDAAAMTKLVARIARVPETAIRELAVRDWNQACLLVAGFLGGTAAPTG